MGLRSLLAPGVLVDFVLTLPFAVAAEEMIFRGCQRRLRMILGPAPTIVAVGLCFAAYHWVPGSPVDRHEIETWLATFAGGAVLAAAYERTASVLLLIAIHLVYDTLAVAQTCLHVGHERAAEAVLFLVWLAAAGALAWRLRRPRRME